MHPRHIPLALALTLPALAQHIDDPANLMGERVSPPALADTLPINHGAPALEQLLRKLRTRASMMLIVAHPDDEDSGLLTLESRGRGARVAMLTLTRGEGGQNLMSADFNDALGLIRTQELLAEDRYTGVDQFFGTEVDFGFSKTKEESFKKWTHDRVLYDAIRSVRLYRPLVLASVFVGGVTDGHGHHQVSGEICQEVFLAAADPKVFPEMGLPPWAPLRVYARVPFSRVTPQGMYDYATGRWSPPLFHNYVTGEDITHEPVASVTIHEGDKPAIPAFNGLSYVQWARQGLALQKSQIGPNVRIPPAGAYDVGYTLIASRPPCPSPTTGSRPTNTESIPTNAGCPMITGDGVDGDRGRNPPDQAPQNNRSEDDLFTGLDTSLPSMIDLAPSAKGNYHVVLVANLGGMDHSIAEAQLDFTPDHPDHSAPRLSEALSIANGLISQIEAWQPNIIPHDEKFNLLHELRIKRVQLNDALVLALGLDASALVANRGNGIREPVPGEKITVHANVSGVQGNGLTIERISLDLDTGSGIQAFPFEVGIEAAHQGTTEVDWSGSLPLSAAVTRPYFARLDNEEAIYRLDESDPRRNAPGTPTPLALVVTVGVAGSSIELRRTVATSAPGQSALDAASIVPRLAVSVDPSVAIAKVTTKDPDPLRTTATIKANARVTGGILGIHYPAEWKIQSSDDRFALEPGQSIRIAVTARPDTLIASKSRFDDPKMQFYPVDRSLPPRSNPFNTQGYRPVGYPGLTYTNFYTPATFRAVAVDVTTAPNLHIAYLAGTGDDVPAFLPSLGVTPTLLTTKDLTLANLQQYDAVLLGVRAYAAHPELSGPGSKPLLDYAAAGGIVITQYNSGGFDPASAPFPYSLPGDPAHNVVEEEQPVTLLAPAAPLLTWPNRISSADFDGWVEERGHGFASDWAPQYTPLLETHDAGQDPQRGGLLIAPVGKGAYIYCAFALYRQLPEGVPGAYRLMSNLLSYSKNPRR